MILDALNLFSDEQAVTASAASTNVIDLGPLHPDNTFRDIGAGEELYLVISVDETATAAGAATVAFALQTDDNEAFSSPTDIFSTAAIAIADLTIGARVVAVQVPRGVEKFLRVNYTVATGPLTAGKFSAFLTTTPQDNVKYANASEIASNA